jgi:hypothetical protein
MYVYHHHQSYIFILIIIVLVYAWFLACYDYDVLVLVLFLSCAPIRVELICFVFQSNKNLSSKGSELHESVVCRYILSTSWLLHHHHSCLGPPGSFAALRRSRASARSASIFTRGGPVPEFNASLSSTSSESRVAHYAHTGKLTLKLAGPTLNDAWLCMGKISGKMNKLQKTLPARLLLFTPTLWKTKVSGNNQTWYPHQHKIAHRLGVIIGTR